MSKILPVGGAAAAVAVAVAVGALTSSSSNAAANSASAPAHTAQLVAKVTPAKATLQAAAATVAGKRQTIILTGAGRPVYVLTGDSAKHPECTSSACLGVWPAVISAHPTLKGVTGKVGVWKHNGKDQVTLDGHPLYTFAGDHSGTATGEGISSFGGTWLTLNSHGAEVKATAGATPTTTTPTATTPTSTTTPAAGGGGGYSNTGNTGYGYSSPGAGW